MPERAPVRPAKGAPPRSARDGILSLARWLELGAGFEQPANLPPLGLAPQAWGLADVCLARREGDDLRVAAFLADEGGSADLFAVRAESFRRALAAFEGAVRGRLRAEVWLVAESAARRDALRGFLDFEDAHFLSKVVVGRGLLCMEDGTGSFAGRGGADPSAADLAAALADPAADPGEARAEAVRAGREAKARAGERDERAAANLLRPGPCPATWTLIGANGAVYLAQTLLTLDLQKGGLSPDVAFNSALLRLGANDPTLSLHGQYWRILACSFLHGGFWHLGMNMYALFAVGAVLERLAGSARLLALYLFAALAAGLASALFAGPGAYSVGASGAIMGLIGALMAPRFRRDPRLPEGLSRRLFRWLAGPVALIFALGLGLRFFNVPLLLDNAAHLGGLLAGFALGYLWPSFLVRPVRRQA